MYSGNPSLVPAIRQRILNTFRQTLDLAAKGSLNEASLGCDFVLQMDPDFGPARALQDRINAATGPVEVADLRAGIVDVIEPEPPAAATRKDEAEELFGGLGELGEVDLGALPAPAPADDLRSRLEERLAARDFAAVLELARTAPQAIAADLQLAHLVETASARQEAAPYVQKFLDAARRSAADGDRAGAGTMLEKARTLDPTHPGLRDPALLLEAPSAGPARPAASARPPAAQFSGAGAHDGDSEDRIAALLAEGEKAFTAGDHQGAIDAWSRIFLIDIDHAEASRRIEEARRLKAEQERRVEEVFHDAADRMESGDRTAAREGFEQVMEIAPGHLAAKEYLDRLSRPEEPPAAAEPRSPTGAVPLPAVDAGAEPPVLRGEILVPPEPSAAAPRRREDVEPTPAMAGSVAGKDHGARRRFVVIGSAVLALAAAALVFVYLNRDRFFPNAKEQAPPLAETVDPIARATRLHDEGKTAVATNQLRRLPPTDPHYEEAQALISQWEASAASAPPVESGPAAEQLAQRAELLAGARDALSRNEALDAEARLDQATAIAPLDEHEAELRSQVDSALAPMAAELRLFRDGEYERALSGLWRLYEPDHSNLDARRLIVDSYYNLAVRDFQRGDVKSAVQRLDEAAKLAPEDTEIARHRLFAQTYQDRTKDLLYRTYVKYLPLPVTQ